MDVDGKSFKCSFQFVYTEYDVDLGHSNVWCGTEHVSRSERVFVLAPSGYRFTVVMDINPTRLKKARVSGFL